MLGVTRSGGILLAIAFATACVEPTELSVDPDSAMAPVATSPTESHSEVQWPIAAGVTSFVTQSAAVSGEPFPCGSGVNSQHILAGEHGENHDYENSLDIVVRNRGAGAQRVPHGGRGTDVVAVAEGIVIAASSMQSECDRTLGAGNYVIIEHPELEADGTPVVSAYMHLNSLASVEQSTSCTLNPAPTTDDEFRMPAVGSHVRAGQKIGELGNTGNSTGTHLHFQFAAACTLAPADSVECKALSVLDVAPQGFADLSIERDQSCDSALAVGGPVAATPSSENYLSDGSYVTSRFQPAPTQVNPNVLASR